MVTKKGKTTTSLYLSIIIMVAATGALSAVAGANYADHITYKEATDYWREEALYYTTQEEIDSCHYYADIMEDQANSCLVKFCVLTIGSILAGAAVLYIVVNDKKAN